MRIIISIMIFVMSIGAASAACGTQDYRELFERGLSNAEIEAECRKRSRAGHWLNGVWDAKWVVQRTNGGGLSALRGRVVNEIWRIQTDGARLLIETQSPNDFAFNQTLGGGAWTAKRVLDAKFDAGRIVFTTQLNTPGLGPSRDSYALSTAGDATFGRDVVQGNWRSVAPGITGRQVILEGPVTLTRQETAAMTPGAAPAGANGRAPPAPTSGSAGSVAALQAEVARQERAKADCERTKARLVDSRRRSGSPQPVFLDCSQWETSIARLEAEIARQVSAP